MKDSIKNLDLRMMPPFERHEKIFKMWNNLKLGEILRITNDHDPRPLHYQFEAEETGKYEWEYEQEGPNDWIVKIKKIDKEKDNKRKIKNLLKELHSGTDINKVKEKGKNLLKNISPKDLALIEQEIIKEGVTRNEMRKLCDVHLEIMKDNLEKVDINVKPGHPIHTFMEEHKSILGFVDKLQYIIDLLSDAKDFDEVKEEIKMLRHVSEHLVEADKHHQREEEVLFPILEKFGVTEPPEIMKEDHKELKAKKLELYKLSKENKIPYSDFIGRIKRVADYLINELPNHIYKEDNILYPMALQVIPKNKWPNIKEKCDKIGYCCFTPIH